MDVDEFSDDGLAELTDNALQELEQRALHLTQAQPQPHEQPPSPPTFRGIQQPHQNYGWEEEDDDLDTSEVINDVGAPISALQQSPPQQNQHLRRRHLLPPPNPRWNPTVDPANRPRPPNLIVPPVANGAISHPSAPGPHSLHTSVPGGQPQSTPLTPHAAPKGSAGVSQTVPTRPGDFTALQQRVRSLEAELNAARGEASIIRSNANKAQHDFDAQVARLKKLNAEQVSRHERTLEAAVAAEKNAQTELEFLQRDFREHRSRVRQQDVANAPPRNTATPKKASKAWAIADGFDGLDIALSPSKGQGRAKTTGPVAVAFGEKTPSKGKRKRPTIESPIPALETHTEDVFMTEPKLDLRPPELANRSTPIVAPTVAPFEFLQLILDHGSFHQEPPTFDILSRFCFPSDPAPVSFAAMIFEKFPLMGSPGRPMQLLVDFAEHIVAMWTRCVDEKFWEPIKYLVSLIAFTFDLHATTAAPLVMPNLVPTAQSTLFTVADARRRAPPDGQPSKAHDELHFLEGHIDTSKILPLLYITALTCASIPSNDEYGSSYGATMYWKLLSLDFVLLLLMPKQKLSDTMAMLELLAFSSLPGSIGPISEELEAAVVARAVIERVSAKLTEHPRVAMTADQRRKLRLGALRTLVAFAMHPFGAMQLACHDNALPRLVTCLSLSLDDLYDQPVQPRILTPLPDALARAMQKLPESIACTHLNRIISQSLLLIHTLVTDAATANAADISQKLSATHGGSQRYLLALGRLTFAEEDLVIEAGIDGEVVEAAHELLEMAVTPDEGQAVSEAFGA